MHLDERNKVRTGLCFTFSNVKHATHTPRHDLAVFYNDMPTTQTHMARNFVLMLMHPEHGCRSCEMKIATIRPPLLATWHTHCSTCMSQWECYSTNIMSLEKSRVAKAPKNLSIGKIPCTHSQVVKYKGTPHTCGETKQQMQKCRKPESYVTKQEYGRMPPCGPQVPCASIWPDATLWTTSALCIFHFCEILHLECFFSMPTITFL